VHGLGIGKMGLFKKSYTSPKDLKKALGNSMIGMADWYLKRSIGTTIW